MPECPIDGCSFTADSRGSVTAHMSSKTDSGHKGIGFQKAEAMLDAHGDAGGSQGSSDGGNGETLSVPSDDSDSDSGGSTEHSCPECNSPAGDVSGLSDGDRVKCTDCGAVLVWSDS